MINLSPPRALARFFTGVTWFVKHEPRTLYLTFDDGPVPGVTDWVLDTLAEYDAKATFFCLGRNAERYPSLLDRIRREGHTVGNHTYSHLRGYNVSVRDYVWDVRIANDILHSSLFRPPYARFTPSQLRALRPHFNIVLWSVLSMDYSKWMHGERCANIVLNNSRGGDVIVFHDSYKAERNLREALPRCLKSFSAQGYEFSALRSSLLVPLESQLLSQTLFPPLSPPDSLIPPATEESLLPGFTVRR